ncbi:MAG: EAL domain-containing protein [Clostridiaceae bacterium]|nr:EAL domain-containing protein [Clostridiaceae bacterium]
MFVKILVVDDSAPDRLIIKNLLTEYEVLTANDGLEAMRLIDEHDDINLIILDLNMPEMDGFQVLEKLKSDDYKFRRIRTIILTNYNELDNEIRGLKLGAVDYIRKPIHMHSLKARIEVHVALLRTEFALEQRLNIQGITFELLFNQSPIGIAISYDKPSSDTTGKSNYRINPMFVQITGRTADELNESGLLAITHCDDLEEELKLLSSFKAGEISGYTIDKRLIKPDSSVIWVHSIMARLILPDEQKYNHIYLIQDITERKEIEKELKESERSKSVLLSHLPGLAYRCKIDRQWTMLFVSDGCLTLTGYSAESLLYNRDLSYNDIIAPEYRESIWKEWKTTLAREQSFKNEYEIITANGERKWVLEIGERVLTKNGEEALEGIVIDISDRKEIENMLKYNNEYDRWTGLHNQYYLENLILSDTKKSSTVNRAIIGINLNSVHALTTMFGFQYSHNLIKELANALAVYSSENKLLCKGYENHFVFYIKDYANKNEILNFCKVLSKTLAPYLTAERIASGIGIVEINPEHELDLDELFRKLLIASEKAADLEDDINNSGICFYDGDLEMQISRENEIKLELSEIASADDLGGLFLQYQPILDLKSNKICGFETLARLHSEKLGVVPPLEFIPIAEETKLIVPIGKKIIQKAFSFLKRLENKGYEQVSVSINLSVIQLLKDEFVNELFKTIETLNINPANIGLEITESVFSSEHEKINRVLGELKDAGIHIYIDDLGTGYSSLSRLRDLNVNSIKLDKSFIDKLMYLKPEETIIGDIISMAHKLCCNVVAEGVEFEAQKQSLSNFGCDKIQGYLISKPLNEDDAIDFLI